MKLHDNTQTHQHTNINVNIVYSSKYDGVEGEYIEKTIDLSTTCGYALMAHKDEGCLKNDFLQLLALQDDLYEIQNEEED